MKDQSVLSFGNRGTMLVVELRHYVGYDKEYTNDRDVAHVAHGIVRELVARLRRREKLLVFKMHSRCG